MNREIKFRGCSTALQKWIYGYLILENGKAIIVNDDQYVFVKPESVGQYTGLKDKNGKEIYEGDIIKFSNHVDEVYEEIGVVDFDLSECGYKATYKTREFNNIMGYYGRTNCIYLINNKEYECEYEVIGNIYESPELLEEVFNRR